MSQPDILRWDQAYNRNGDPKLQRAVVNVIRTYMNNHTLTGWVSQETLAEATGMQVRGVRKQIAANVEAGWLEVVKQGRTGKSTEYRLTYSQPVPQDRLDDTDLNRSHRTGYTTQPVPQDRLLPVPQDRPTSSRTSPQEKFSRETPTGGLAVEGTEHDHTSCDGTTTTEPASAGSSAEPEARLSSRDSDPWGGSTSDPATATEATEGHRGSTPDDVSEGFDWSQYDLGEDQDMSAKAQRIRAHVPIWRRTE